MTRTRAPRTPVCVALRCAPRVASRALVAGLGLFAPRMLDETTCAALRVGDQEQQLANGWFLVSFPLLPPSLVRKAWTTTGALLRRGRRGGASSSGLVPKRSRGARAAARAAVTRGEPLIKYSCLNSRLPQNRAIITCNQVRQSSSSPRNSSSSNSRRRHPLLPARASTAVTTPAAATAARPRQRWLRAPRS